jgi:hypothetical protein
VMQGNTTLTVTPIGERDNVGDRTADGPPRQIPGCLIAPSSTADINAGLREGVETVVTVFAPAGAQIGPHERVDIPGRSGSFRTVGDTSDWAHPSGWEPGVTIQLRKVVG